MRAIRAIEDCDVCLIMLDATDGMQKQDSSLITVGDKNKQGVVLLVNKWDVIEKDTLSTKQYEEDIISKIAPFTDLPILFISALNKQRIHKALDVAMEVYHNRKQKISTSKLNDVMLEAIERNPPPSTKGKYIKIYVISYLPFSNFCIFLYLPQYIKILTSDI